MQGGSLVAVDEPTVHADVRGHVLLRGRQPPPKARGNGPLRQPLHVHVLVLALDLHPQIQAMQISLSTHLSTAALSPHALSLLHITLPAQDVLRPEARKDPLGMALSCHEG